MQICDIFIHFHAVFPSLIHFLYNGNKFWFHAIFVFMYCAIYIYIYVYLVELFHWNKYKQVSLL